MGGVEGLTKLLLYEVLSVLAPFESLKFGPLKTLLTTYLVRPPATLGLQT